MVKHSFVLAMVCLAAIRMFAVDCSVKLSYRTVTAGNALCLVNISYPYGTQIPIAANRWNDACDGGYTTPQINYGGGCSSTDVPVRIVYEARVSDNPMRSCAHYQRLTSGANTGGTITMFKYGQNLQTLEIYPCSERNPTDILLHELGHALGLADVLDESCYGHFMGARFGTMDRMIRADDCSAVNQLWTSEQEQNDLCTSRCWTTCEAGVCPPEPTTTVPTPCQTSPVLIDLDNNGFHLVGLDGAVSFDIDGDGVSNRISWTAGGADDAFLVYDRNGNGRIDSGRELFGNATLLRSGQTATNGYESLAEFDDPAAGGNGDALLTPADAVWGLLQVWADTNHNGTSESGELRTLSDANIVALDTTYRQSNRRDAHGNMFRFRSSAVVQRYDHVHPAPTYDVFFTEER